MTNEYLRTIAKAGDRRIKGMPLVDSPMPVIAFCGIYITLVWMGPRIMKKYPPFKLEKIMFFYNITMAALNGYIVFELFRGAYKRKYNAICEPVIEDFHPEELKISQMVWLYYITKLLEFSDTVFFILRKKTSQLSFLHIYHHGTMFPLMWLVVKFIPTGGTTFRVILNSFVHVVMYTYYVLTTFGPKIQKFLWWKKYLTLLQLIQFALTLMWSIYSIISDCEYPKWINYISIIYMTTFLILFGKFYMKKYKTN